MISKLLVVGVLVAAIVTGIVKSVQERRKK